MQILVWIGCILRSGNVPALNINAIWSESIKSYLKKIHSLSSFLELFWQLNGRPSFTHQCKIGCRGGIVSTRNISEWIFVNLRMLTTQLEHVEENRTMKNVYNKSETHKTLSVQICSSSHRMATGYFLRNWWKGDITIIPIHAVI